MLLLLYCSIFSTLAYLMPEAYSKPCQISKMMRHIENNGIVRTVHSDIFRHIQLGSMNCMHGDERAHNVHAQIFACAKLRAHTSIKTLTFKGNAQFIFLCNSQKLSVNVCPMKKLKSTLIEKVIVCLYNLGEKNFCNISNFHNGFV